MQHTAEFVCCFLVALPSPQLLPFVAPQMKMVVIAATAAAKAAEAEEAEAAR